eukprot:s325_g9.t2
MNDVLRQASSEDKAWFHIYLDNFCAGERVLPEQASLKGAICHEQAERAWATAGVVSSDKKRVAAASVVSELGAEVDGIQRTLGVNNEKLLKLIHATLWLVVQPFLNRKHLQIIMGRWVFVLQFRRPAMATLEHVWKFIGGTDRITFKLKQHVKRELLQLVLLVPLLHCNLGAGVEPNIIATDASEQGCAVVSSNQLSSEGVDYLQAARRVESPGASEIAPILVISLFNGIGGTYRCYDAIGILPCGRIAVECDAGANRITQRRWPGTLVVEDVHLVDRALVRQWSSTFLQVREVHIWGGFPCTDLSAVKYNRENLEGRNSRLFWEIPRIRDLVAEEFGEAVTVKTAVENVASMDETACQEISEALETVPYRLDPSDAVPMRRPRFAWVSEPLEGVFPDVAIEAKRYWREVTARAPYPESSQWLEPGHCWDGERQGAIFPTCMKAIPRRKPPPRPAGLHKCSALTISRWTEDQFRYPPYQYSEQFIISTEHSWRLLSAEEKEILLGYGFSHTAVVWSASKIKGSMQGFDDARHSYLGDSFSVFSFCVVAGALCRNFMMQMSYEHVAARLGMAPGFRAHIKSRIPLCRLMSSCRELIVLVKGISMGLRSVLSTLFLMMVIIYVFAIIFTQLFRGSEEAQGCYDGVLESMNCLMLNVVFPEQQELMARMLELGPMTYLLGIFYLLITGLTVMNMLIGVLVEVVSVTAQVDKEETAMKAVKDKIEELIPAEVRNATGITREHFMNVIMDQGLVQTLATIDVDVMTVVEYPEIMYHSRNSLSVPELVDAILQFRRTTSVSMMDIAQLRRFMVNELEDLRGLIKSNQII